MDGDKAVDFARRTAMIFLGANIFATVFTNWKVLYNS